MQERTLKLLLVLGCSVMLVTMIILTTGNGVHAFDSGSVGQNATAQAEANTSSSAIFKSTISTHTMLSSVFILGLAAIGLMILGWGQPGPKRPPLR